MRRRLDRPVQMTVAPASPRATAMPRPAPRVAPATIATLPARGPSLRLDAVVAVAITLILPDGALAAPRRRKAPIWSPVSMSSLRDVSVGDVVWHGCGAGSPSTVRPAVDAGRRMIARCGAAAQPRISDRATSRRRVALRLDVADEAARRTTPPCRPSATPPVGACPTHGARGPWGGPDERGRPNCSRRQTERRQDATPTAPTRSDPPTDGRISHKARYREPR